MKKFISLLFAAVFLLPISAMANTITVTGSIAEDTVSYIYFSLDATATATVKLSASSEYFDTVFYVFEDETPLKGKYLVNSYKLNNDGTEGSTMEALLTLVDLAAGDYVVAVGDDGLKKGPAMGKGKHNVSNNDYGTYSMTISSETGNVSVPEPASIALLGFALLGFGATRRRAK